jgi:hypothetical protein
MEPYAYQLRDIRGLDGIPWWPLAPGWWLLAAGIILGFWLAWRLLPHLKIPAVMDITWRWDAARHLRNLRRRARDQDPRDTLAELSELLRRIAMARYGRDACAAITGREWLEWLQSHDPQGYNWTDRGGIMLDLPYAPPGYASAEVMQLLEMIDAAQNWVARGADDVEANDREEPARV